MGVIGKLVGEGAVTRVDFATGSTDDYVMNASEQIIYLSNTSSSDCQIFLPPVQECAGMFYSFFKTDSGTQSVLLNPNSFISSTLDGGDSIDWGGSTGYDFDAQYDWLLLYSNGQKWCPIAEGTGIS